MSAVTAVAAPVVTSWPVMTAAVGAVAPLVVFLAFITAMTPYRQRDEARKQRDEFARRQREELERQRADYNREHGLPGT